MEKRRRGRNFEDLIIIHDLAELSHRKRTNGTMTTNYGDNAAHMKIDNTAIKQHEIVDSEDKEALIGFRDRSQENCKDLFVKIICPMPQPEQDHFLRI